MWVIIHYPDLNNLILWLVGRGHIAVQEPAAWNLSGGYPLREKSHSGAEGYSISVFHQVHCLVSPSSEQTYRSELIKFQAAIKSRFLRLSNSSTYSDTEKHIHSLHRHERRKLETELQHINHCFDYLRQAVMCSGDTTLEKAVVGDDGNVERIIEGWGVEHQCRDYDAIYAFAAANHAHNETGID
jgi:hypothetical protein